MGFFVIFELNNHRRANFQEAISTWSDNVRQYRHVVVHVPRLGDEKFVTKFVNNHKIISQVRYACRRV